MYHTELTKSEFIGQVSSIKHGYLLLESELLENEHYDAQTKHLIGKLPTLKYTEDQVEEIDFHANCTRLWEGTLLDDFLAKSPVLVQPENLQALTNKYLDTWANWNGGIFIDAYDNTHENNIIEHLQSILMVSMPDEGEVHFRIQENRKLLGVIESIESESRLSLLLGPIKKIYWQHNVGVESYLYSVTNKSSHADKIKTQFNFTSLEKKRLDIAEYSWYKKNIISLLLNIISKKKKFTKHLQKYSTEDLGRFFEQGYLSAQVNGFKNEKNIKTYLFSHLMHPNILKKEHFRKIITNTEWTESKKINMLKKSLDNKIEKNYE